IEKVWALEKDYGSITPGNNSPFPVDYFTSATQASTSITNNDRG
ncbi:unnamed protein product, partial [Linum tenue]